MTELLQYVVLGLGVGSIYALLAQGVLVVYRGSGVVNFAQGAFALAGASVYLELHRALGAAPAVAAAAAAGLVLGVLTQNLVMRPLRSAAPVTRVIGTLGVLLTLQSIGFQIYGSTPVGAPQYLPHDPLRILGVTIQTERVVLLAICLALTVAFTVGERRTLIGLTTRAAAENDVAVATLGWSPNRLATFSWGTGGALAGLAGALIVPLTGLVPVNITMLIVPALAAALLGRFESFWLTLAGALGIGVVQALLQGYWTQTGVTDAVPFAVIIIILVVTGRSLPLRSQLNDRLPSIGSGRIRPLPVVLALAVSVVLMLAIFSPGWVDAFTVSLSVSLVLLSVVVLTGYAGQLSLAQYAMAGLGAYVSGRLVSAQGWPFELALLAGVAAAVPIGFVFAVPALRTRGVNLAVVSLGVGVAVNAVLFNNVDLTGGFQGTNVGFPKFLGIDIDATMHPERYGVFVVACFAIAAGLVANLRRGAAGRRLIAIRENERAAASLGISVVGTKLYAFAIASAIAALGGVLIAFRSSSIVYTGFDPLHSISAAGFAVIGGVGYLTGPLLGSTLTDSGVSSLFQGLLSGIETWLPLIGGVVIIVTLLLNPDGLVPELRGQAARAGRIAGRAFRRSPAEARQRRARGVRRILEAPATQDIHRVEPRTLDVADMTVRFGGVVALDGVSLSVAPGEVVGLIGPNGAGKTTLIDAISGYVKPTSGAVRLDGRDLTRTAAAGRVRAGVARSWQSLELFEDISVMENVMIASEAMTWRRRQGLWSLLRPRPRPLNPAAAAAVTEFELQSALPQMPSELPYSRRRLVGIARTVALSPGVLLLDEPAAGLSSIESRELGRLIRRLADTWGMGILLVEHDVDLVMGICDRIVVLNFGQPVCTGTPEEVRADPAVVSAYLGVDEPASDEASESRTKELT